MCISQFLLGNIVTNNLKHLSPLQKYFPFTQIHVVYGLLEVGLPLKELHDIMLNGQKPKYGEICILW